ncbi:hypothetical protein ONZ45_g6339 [Pleurotus djamor]|nr:hypothetical protein ONZ45_g6339 [Pleurotus djamor]
MELASFTPSTTTIDNDNNDNHQRQPSPPMSGFFPSRSFESRLDFGHSGAFYYLFGPPTLSNPLSSTSTQAIGSTQSTHPTGSTMGAGMMNRRLSESEKGFPGLQIDYMRRCRELEHELEVLNGRFASLSDAHQGLLDFAAITWPQPISSKQDYLNSNAKTTQSFATVRRTNYGSGMK